MVSALSALTVAAAILSVLAGATWLAPAELLRALTAPELDVVRLIVLDIRMPRVVLGVAIGGILGLSGAVLQGLLRNPLAEPGLLGISAAASLGAVLAIYFGLSTVFVMSGPVCGLLGALIATAASLGLARGGGTLALILAGTAVSSVAAAGVSLALNLAPNPYAAYEITTWLLGSLADRSWDHVELAMPFILAGAALLLSCGRALDALVLGEAQAASLGINLARTRWLALLGIALGVGAATAVAGAIGFVGLVAPHLVRPLVKYQPSRVLLPAALVGALIVTLADIATRVVRTGPELKLGVFISLLGAPFFLWLVLHVRKTTL